MSKFKMSEERRKIRREVLPMLLSKQITYKAAKERYGVPIFTLKKWVDKEVKKVNEIMRVAPDASSRQIFANLLSTKQVAFLAGLQDTHIQMQGMWGTLFGAEKFKVIAEMSEIAAEEKFKSAVDTMSKIQKMSIDMLKFSMDFSDHVEAKSKEKRNPNAPVDVTPRPIEEVLPSIPKDKQTEIYREAAELIVNAGGITEYDRIAEEKAQSVEQLFKRKIVKSGEELDSPDDF